MTKEKDEIKTQQTENETEKEAEKKEKGKASRKEKLIEKELEEKDKKISELENALKDSEDKYLRMLAEYDNYKKRTQKEKEAIYTDAKADSVENLLAVLDNLERGTKVEVASTEAKSVVEGVEKILVQAVEIFAKMGVEEIPALGESFNPELHNAVMHEENEEFDENTVSEVFLKGYKIGDKVIRHSMVKVAN